MCETKDLCSSKQETAKPQTGKRRTAQARTKRHSNMKKQYTTSLNIDGHPPGAKARQSTVIYLGTKVVEKLQKCNTAVLTLRSLLALDPGLDSGR